MITSPNVKIIKIWGTIIYDLKLLLQKKKHFGMINQLEIISQLQFILENKEQIQI